MKLYIACIAALFQVVRCARRSVVPLHKSLRAEIDALTNAVEEGDVHSVERIFSLLSAEAQKRAPTSTTGHSATEGHKGALKAFSKPHTTVPSPVSLHSQVHVPRQNIGVHSEKSSQLKLRKSNESRESEKSQAQTEKKEVQCVLDDVIFSLMPESKLELYKELEDPVLKEAFTWVRSGGWWHCAMYGEMCTCHGSARMVASDYSAESVPLDLTLSGNSVTCDVASFQNVDVKPGGTKICECSHPLKNGLDNFHLHKRLTSKSYLQEAWVFLLRLLGRAKMLPLGTGDRLYHGMQNWAARHSPWNMPMVLERVWVHMFVQKVVAPIKPGPRCLEWGDPNNPGHGFNYAFMIPECTQPIDMQYEPIMRRQKTYSVEGNIVYSDVNNLPVLLTATGDWRVNLIFATQVFEHLYNPEYAGKMLFESLLPGGVLVFTAPQQAQFHKIPGDYFRYTKEGCVHLLQNSGFCVPAWAVAGGGDFVFDIARDAGLQVQDFPNEEVQGAFQEGYNSVSDSAITIHAMGFKPPHWACDSAMAPIR